MPLTAAICTGSLPESVRVRLLSIAQARQAPAMARAPQAKPTPLHDSTTPPATIATAPTKMRRSTLSRKTVHAMTRVSTLSRLSSSAADAAGVAASPVISSTGPTAPPANTTSANRGRSRRASGASAAAPPRAARKAANSASPTPDAR
jgi:hypothetical protein